MIFAACLLPATLVAPGCITNDTDTWHHGPSFTDPRDGQTYAFVSLGSQVWMTRDLSYRALPSYCYDDSDNCPPDGRLYPWETAITACPPGWRLPTEQDWAQLERALGMPESEIDSEGFRGFDQGARLRSGGSTRFKAPLSGYRRPDGSYARAGSRSAYWLATSVDKNAAWHRDIRSDDPRIYRSAVPKGYALSVRCMRNRPR